MRASLGLSLICAVAVAASSVRAEDAAAQALLDRAINAHGGAEPLGKTRQLSRKATGDMSLFGKDLAFKSEETMDLPNRFRAAFELTVGDQKLPLTLVIDGNRGWRAMAGMVAEMPKEELQELKEEMYVWWVVTLVPLKDRTFDLTAVPDSQVHGKPAAGLRAIRVGHEDVRLYFDKGSGLLVKVERRGKEAGATVAKEYLFSEHKAFDSVQLPTKYTNITNGKKMADVTSISYRLLSKFEEGTFGRP